MAHDVFISYSHVDKSVADAASATLEATGIRCWIAPRDISPGAEWGEAIIEAIDGARVMVLVFSSNTNESRQVRREVEHAVAGGVTIMPIRIEQATPTRSLAYFMAGVHWLDALTPPLEQHLRQLAVSIKALLEAVSAGETALVDKVDERSNRTTREWSMRRDEDRRQLEPSAPRSRKPITIALAALVIIGVAIVAVIQTGQLTRTSSQKESAPPPPISTRELATVPAPAIVTAPPPTTTPAPPAAVPTPVPAPDLVPAPAPQKEPSASITPLAPTPQPSSPAVPRAAVPKAPTAVISAAHDGLWLGFRRCPEWRGRQAFQAGVRMTIQNNKAASITVFPADSPGYVTYQGTVDPNGMLLLRGYGISGGLPGGLPRGSRYPFLYEGTISGDSYSAKDIGVPRPCTLEMTRQH